MGLSNRALISAGRSLACVLQARHIAASSLGISTCVSVHLQEILSSSPAAKAPALAPLSQRSGGNPEFPQHVASGYSFFGALVAVGFGLTFGFSAASCDATQVAETLEHEHHHPHLQKQNKAAPEPPGESPTAKPQSHWGFSLMNQSMRRRIFFYYEKRIRTRSPPEKVFEYFASIKGKGSPTLMTPADLMRAVVPVFPPSDSPFSRTGSLAGEPSQGALRCPESKLFKLFDTDGDGLISFSEYIFFVTLLSIPLWEVEQTFRAIDLDGSGMVDRDEFKEMMAELRKQTKAGRNNRGGLRFLSGLKKTGKAQRVDEGGVVEYFFGKDGTKSLSLEEFRKFIEDLQAEITKLEFAHYDWRNEGSISAQDFALSMVASADMEQLGPLMAQVDKLAGDEAFKNVRISYDDFWAFAHCRWVVPRLENALERFLSHAPGNVDGLTRDEFREAVQDVCGVSFDDVTVEIIYRIFDADGNGRISCSEFMTAADALGELRDKGGSSWWPL